MQSSVTTPPSLLVSDTISGDSYTDYGDWCIYQLITPSDQDIFTNGILQIAGYQNNANTGSGPEVIVYGHTGSDIGVPYGGYTYSANGNPYGNSDSPGADLPATSDELAANASVMTAKDDANDFEDYLMYAPPTVSAASNPVVWVPLSEFTWHFEFHATKDPSTQYWSTNNESKLLNPAVACNSYPTWNYFVPSPVIYLAKPSN